MGNGKISVDEMAFLMEYKTPIETETVSNDRINVTVDIYAIEGTNICTVMMRDAHGWTHHLYNGPFTLADAYMDGYVAAIKNTNKRGGNDCK